MANKLYDEADIQNIANAIRYKNGTSNKYLVSEMSDAIRAIVSSSGDTKEEQEKSITITENGTTEVLPDEGKVLSKTLINVLVPERYDEGYSLGKQDGYNEGYQASQDSIIYQEKTVTENGEVVADEGYTALSKVNVAIPIKEEQTKTVDITENGTVEVIPDEDKTLLKVTVNVNVSGEVDTTDYLGLLITQNLENVYSDVSGTLVPYAFYENEGVKTIELPNIQYLKERCFYGCGNLTTLKLPGLIGYTYQYMASGCSKLVDVDIRNTSYVSSYTFQNCTSLKKLDLHKVGTISANAFTGATKLETLIIRTNTIPELGSTNAFTNTKIKSGGTGYIYVHSALIDNYKNATNWSTFASQIRAIEDYPEITGGIS